MTHSRIPTRSIADIAHPYNWVKPGDYVAYWVSNDGQDQHLIAIAEDGEAVKKGAEEVCQDCDLSLSEGALYTFLAVA